MRAENAQETPTQSPTSPSILECEYQKVGLVDRLIVFWLAVDHCLVLPRGRSHKTRRCRGVTYPESFITRYTTCNKIDGWGLVSGVKGLEVGGMG